MREIRKIWFSEFAEAKLTRERLIAEIRRVSRLKIPVSEKMHEIRYLIEGYFKMDCNEEFLDIS